MNPLNDSYEIRTYKYNRKGYKILVKEYDLDFKGKNVHEVKYKYNKRGNVIKQKGVNKKHFFLRRFRKQILRFKYDYKFDNKGNLLLMTKYNSTVKLNHKTIYNKTVYKYDLTGNIIEITLYSHDNKLLDNSLYKYNDKGYVYEIDNLKPDGNMGSKYIYKYDEYNNIIEFSYVRDGIDCYNKYENFDKTGNWQKQFWHIHGNEFIIEREITYYE